MQKGVVFPLVAVCVAHAQRSLRHRTLRTTRFHNVFVEQARAVIGAEPFASTVEATHSAEIGCVRQCRLCGSLSLRFVS